MHVSEYADAKCIFQIHVFKYADAKLFQGPSSHTCNWACIRGFHLSGWKCLKNNEKIMFFARFCRWAQE
jgi:hypothetical protein